MSNVEYQAANITAPYQNGTAFQCIWGTDVDTNSDNTDLTTVFGQFSDGDYITLANDGAVTLRYFLATASSTISATAVGTGTTVGWPLFAGEKESIRVQGRTFLHYICASSTTALMVYRSSTPPGIQPGERFKTPSAV